MLIRIVCEVPAGMSRFRSKAILSVFFDVLKEVVLGSLMHVPFWYSDLHKQSPARENLSVFILVLSGEAQRCLFSSHYGRKQTGQYN